MSGIARIHLDPIGGIAGDMFVAAMADAFPACVPGLLAELRKLSRSLPESGRRDEGDDAGIALLPHADASLRGLRFVVAKAGAATPAHGHAPHDHGHAHAHPHHHVPHRTIRERLRAAGLQPQVLEHALGLFQLLAEAEGRVHGTAPDDVEFHEVGAWDSIVDFVAAAYFVATLAPARWSFAPLPLGGGRVSTAHGVMPVPAPATTLLLEGLAVVDDGIAGERVTPTGAAIVRYLAGARGEPGGAAALSVAASGNGFGTRTLPGIPNLLRVLAFTAATEFPAPHDEEIATLAFEIDDQTAEDLAVALERIRAAPGVLDASQVAVYGKKNRLATQVQVLARLEAADAVADLCLAETTTLGVRIARTWRRTALRAEVETAVPQPVRVKLAERPSGEVTAKAEMDDLARAGGDRAAREQARRRAEARALETARPHDPRHSRDD